MKNKRLVYHYQSAKIYRHYYKPSFNLLRLFKSIMAILFTSHSAAATHYQRHK